MRVEDQTAEAEDTAVLSPEIRKTSEKLAVQAMAVKALVDQTLEVRGEYIETFFEVEGGLPCLVAIDQEGRNIGQGDGSDLLLCLLYRIVESVEEDGTVGPKNFVCVGEDNLVYKVGPSLIAGVGEEVAEDSALRLGSNGFFTISRRSIRRSPADFLDSTGPLEVFLEKMLFL